MTSRNVKKPLWDHIKEGKTFTPQFLHGSQAGKFQEAKRYETIIPEIVWIALIINKFGFKSAVEIVLLFTKTCQDITTFNETPFWEIISEYERINDSDAKKIIVTLEESKNIHRLKESLLPLITCFPKCPLNFLFINNEPHIPTDDMINNIGDVLVELMDKTSKLYVYTVAISFAVENAAEKILMPKDMPDSDWNINLVINYPETETSRNMAGRLRAFLLSTFEYRKSSVKAGINKWVDYFWNTGRGYGECNLVKPIGIDISEISQDFLRYHLECFKEYYENSCVLLSSIADNYQSEHGDIATQIILGLLTRIYKTTVQCISFIPNWTAETSEMFLRVVCDNYIIFKWLLERGKTEDFLKFYNYGLGQQKLLSEHIRYFCESNDIPKDKANELNLSLAYLRSHRMPELVEVNVGHWHEKNTREMAKEVGLDAVYNLIYSPTSSAIHGMFDTIDRYCFLQCSNPFHRLHKVPFFWAKSPISTYSLMNVSAFTDMGILLLLEKTGKKIEEKKPGEVFIDKIFSYTPNEPSSESQEK